MYEGSQLDGFVHSMFMPIFFILSGVFFCVKQPFGEWMRKKAKSMVLPCVIFYTLTYLLNVVLVTFLHVELKSGFSYSDIFVVFYKDVYPNSAIWFLLALFWCSCILYWVIKSTDKLWGQLTIVGICYAIGYVLENAHINIPLYADTAFSAVPLLYTGYLVKRYDLINKLQALDAVKQYVLVIAMSAACFLFDWFFGSSASMVNNTCNSVLFLVSGITGSISVIGLSYILKRLPLVSYIGRYSMLVLCTHMYLTNAFAKILMKFDIPFILSSMAAVLLVLLCYYAIVPMVKRIKILDCII